MYCSDTLAQLALYLFSCLIVFMLHDRTIRAMPVVIPNQVAPHIAIGVVLDGVHWHCDVGYGGRGVRLPIRNDLVHSHGHEQLVSGQLCTCMQCKSHASKHDTFDKIH